MIDGPRPGVVGLWAGWQAWIEPGGPGMWMVSLVDEGVAVKRERVKGVTVTAAVEWAREQAELIDGGHV